MNTRRKTTIYDIAHKAGTSASTVSYALNGTWRERRIAPTTVQRIREIADAEGYRPNQQARGLKSAVSGLSGMILPEHDTKFFSDLSQAFALAVRARGNCPAIVHSGRDPVAQAESVRSLLSYNVDNIVIAGATNPEELADMCRAAGLRHVFADHPCPGAPSVVTDSNTGAADLTRAMLDRLADPQTADIQFLGGTPGLPSTEARRDGFLSVLQERHLPSRAENVHLCGYDADHAEHCLRQLLDQTGRWPDALFVNSILCFEGVARLLIERDDVSGTAPVLGCFDYDPFLRLLRVPVIMVRQRAKEMIRLCFELLDTDGTATETRLVAPQLFRESERHEHETLRSRPLLK